MLGSRILHYPLETLEVNASLPGGDAAASALIERLRAERRCWIEVVFLVPEVGLEATASLDHP
jgi:hypothetical protein